MFTALQVAFVCLPKAFAELQTTFGAKFLGLAALQTGALNSI